MKKYEIRYNKPNEVKSGYLTDTVEADGFEFDNASNAYFFKSQDPDSGAYSAVLVAASRDINQIKLVKAKKK